MRAAVMPYNPNTDNRTRGVILESADGIREAASQEHRIARRIASASAYLIPGSEFRIAALLPHPLG